MFPTDQLGVWVSYSIPQGNIESAFIQVLREPFIKVTRHRNIFSSRYRKVQQGQDKKVLHFLLIWKRPIKTEGYILLLSI